MGRALVAKLFCYLTFCYVPINEHPLERAIVGIWHQRKVARIQLRGEEDSSIIKAFQLTSPSAGLRAGVTVAGCTALEVSGRQQRITCVCSSSGTCKVSCTSTSGSFWCPYTTTHKLYVPVSAFYCLASIILNYILPTVIKGLWMLTWYCTEYDATLAEICLALLEPCHLFPTRFWSDIRIVMCDFFISSLNYIMRCI